MNRDHQRNQSNTGYSDPIFFLDFIYLLLEKGKGGREASICERNIYWLPPAHPQLGTWPTTQACVLTGIKPATLWFAADA